MLWGLHPIELRSIFRGRSRMTNPPERPDFNTAPIISESSGATHPIRSFIRRQGRITVAQSRALEGLWPQFGLSEAEPFNARAAFGRAAPVVLEIGFGNGDSLADMAAADPDSDFIGIEVHRPGVGHLLLRLGEENIGNVRIFCADALEILTRHIPDNSLDRVQLYFPDPWPKKRHHKRRIVNKAFLELISDKLKIGGLFHAATDWEAYAEHMLEALGAAPRLENTMSETVFAPRPNYRPLTKFESRGKRLGHGVWDLIYRRI